LKFYVPKVQIPYTKPNISDIKIVQIPTKLKLSIVITIYDIMFPGYLVSSDAFCYISEIIPVA